jgi:hypothetical protein
VAKITAHMLVSPPNGYGGTYPTHAVFLSENDRPAWMLLPLEFSPGDSPGPLVTWIPSEPSRVLEDALLMIAIHVLRDENLIREARVRAPNLLADRVDLHFEPIGEALDDFRRTIRGPGRHADLVLTVLQGSIISNQLDVLADYAFSPVICVPREAGVR